MDLWQSGEDRYVRVIDYKSGRTEYKPEEMYAGLQLQLPVYLEATQQSYGAKPAGFFYFHLMPQMQEGEKMEVVEDFKHLMLKNGRLDGLFLDDLEVVQRMDRDIMDDPTVLKAKVTKSGQFMKNKLSATPEQFAMLKEFTHEKIRELGEGIGGGNIAQSPVQWGQNQACDFCEFRRACPFDEHLPGQEYRSVEKMSAADFWEKIEK